jgi:hypothetical protein
MVNEARAHPILDVKNLDQADTDRIRGAFRALLREERQASADELEECLSELDAAVLAAFGLEDRLPELLGGVADLLAFRETGSGSNRGVLVDGSVQRRVTLQGAERLGRAPTQGQLPI